MTKIVAAFDKDAQAQGLQRDVALERLSRNPDPLAVKRGERMETTINRHTRLERQREALESSGPVYRMVAFARDFDGEVAEGAYEDFEPAVPLTLEGVLSAVFGFFVALFGGGSAFALNRWRKNRKEKAAAALAEEEEITKLGKAVAEKMAATANDPKNAENQENLRRLV